MPIFVIALIGIVLLAAGCSNRIIFPGNGPLVIVDFDESVDKCPLVTEGGTTITVGSLIRKAVHYWDVAGARLRTRDQLLPEEQAEAADAPILHIEGDCSLAGTKSDQYATSLQAFYTYGTGKIDLYLPFWKTRDIGLKAYWWTIGILAHEMGHAIGLDHVDDPAAVMYPHDTDFNARSNLAPADMVEYARVWGQIPH